MTQETAFTVRIDREKQEQIDQLARRFHRSRDWVVAQAIDMFLEVQRWQVEQTKTAIAEADAEDFASQEEVETLNNKYLPGQ
jgi:RHH-type rel operon transcriptional repressor/antitoxin RelB